VVHIHWFDPYLFSNSLLKTLFKTIGTLVELLVLRLMNVSIVWTCHNVKAHDTPHPRIEFLFKRVFIGTCLCEHMFVHCEKVKNELLTTYGLDEAAKSRMTAIPHGHYIDNHENTVEKPTAQRELSVEDAENVFLFFGLIRPYKNVVSLIEAFKRVATPDERLVIAGNPSDEAIGHRVREAVGDDDRILTRLQFIPSDRIQVYMNAADAVVLPLENITMSGSTILGMSFERALIVPRIGCIPEIIGDDGAVMYDPDDPDGLADALTAAGERPLYSMGAYNGRLARKKDWSEAAARIVEQYRALTDGATSPEPSSGTNIE
jgi:glycosyltransferase involved in cell wall biosynthesis